MKTDNTVAINTLGSDGTCPSRRRRFRRPEVSPASGRGDFPIPLELRIDGAAGVRGLPDDRAERPEV